MDASHSFSMTKKNAILNDDGKGARIMVKKPAQMLSFIIPVKQLDF